MRTRLTTVAVLMVATTIATLAAADAARATGFGVYGSLGAGSADWRNDHFGGYDNVDETRDTSHGGAGLVFDAAAPFSPLGYRLSVGWERITQERQFDTPRLELEGVVVDQDLMVQLIGGPGPLRMWVGPELRLGFFNGSFDGVDADEDFLALGLGPVFGLDFDVSPGLSISWKLGALFTGYSGRNNSSSIDDSSLGEGHAFANLSILFSPWGNYRHQPQQRGYEPQQQPGYPPPAPPPPGYNPRRW
jgi:hypothetical protein